MSKRLSFTPFYRDRRPPTWAGILLSSPTPCPPLGTLLEWTSDPTLAEWYQLYCPRSLSTHDLARTSSVSPPPPMKLSTPHRQLLSFLSSVLMGCFVGGLMIVLYMFVMFIFFDDWIYKIHSYWFSLSKSQLDYVFYLLIGATKLFIFCAFLLPSLSLKWYLCQSLKASPSKK